MEAMITALMRNRVIKTGRLILRPFTMEDAEDMYAYASDETQTTYVFPKHETLEETERILAEMFIATPQGKYAIELEAAHRVIGSIDLRVNANDKTGELGYILNQHYEGQGYMTEAAKALIIFGFETLGLNELHAYYIEGNDRSERVMQRIGMTYRGTLPQFKIHRGVPVDFNIYSITVDTYHNMKRDGKVFEV